MRKHWKAKATTADGATLVLHTETTDARIATDLGLPAGKSLIQQAIREQISREPFTDAMNHSALGSEALQMHCHYHKITFDAPSFQETDEPLPDRDMDNCMGGEGQTFLMPIWEEKATD